jgi:lysocardiolipin and lysophospholipid acyltransferase
MHETLVPRVKGFVSTIQELRNTPGMNLVLYDTTLMFTDSVTGAIEYPNKYPVGGPSLWSLMMGRPSSEIHLHVKRYTMSQLPTGDEELEQWLTQSFVVKNEMIANFRKTSQFPNPCKQPLQFPSMNIPP